MTDESMCSRQRSGLPTNECERVIDVDVTLLRLGGNRELFRKLVHFYFDDAPRLMHQLRHAAVHGDLVQLERTAHTLKSLAANFEALQAAGAALRVEERAQARDLGAAVDAIPELESQLRRLDVALAGYADGWPS